MGRSWEPDAASGYLYNAVHRHYFQPKTGMYYGGDPPAWTLKPSIPAEALYSDGSNGSCVQAFGSNHAHVPLEVSTAAMAA